MKATTTAILIFAATVFSPAASAFDGNHLLRACSVISEGPKSSGDYQSAAYCRGLVNGVASVMTFNDAGLYRICPAKGSNIGVNQFARIVIKYMRDNPDKLDMGGAYLTAIALMIAYPCT